MAEEMNPRMRTISVRRDGAALVPINALVSRGLQDVATLVALGCDDETCELAPEQQQASTTRSRQVRERQSQLNPRKIAATVKLMKAAVDDGISGFAAFVEFVAEEFGREKTLAIADYLESGWRALGQRSDFQHIDAAGKVTDVLGRYRDGKDQEADGEA